MIKTVYGPPPADEERIEATGLEMDSSIRGEEATAATTAAAKAQWWKKGVRQARSLMHCWLPLTQCLVQILMLISERVTPNA